jgi:hypothetical protein
VTKRQVKKRSKKITDQHDGDIANRNPCYKYISGFVPVVDASFEYGKYDGPYRNGQENAKNQTFDQGATIIRIFY